MSQEPNLGLGGVLTSIADTVGPRVDVNDEQSLKSQQFQKAGSLQGTVDQTASIPVKNGEGEEKTPKKTTAWVTIDGTATIMAPGTGNWSVTARDVVAGKTIFTKSGVKANEPIPFHYKTGWSTQLDFKAVWSEKADTTLKLHTKAHY